MSSPSRQLISIPMLRKILMKMKVPDLKDLVREMTKFSWTPMVNYAMRSWKPEIVRSVLVLVIGAHTMKSCA
jgi:hypothetical protein